MRRTITMLKPVSPTERWRGKSLADDNATSSLMGPTFQ
jgi:hypothetical protein